jgi:hypothetical protein
MPDGFPFISAAYAVFWIVFVVYAINLRRVRTAATKHYDDATHDGAGARP